MKPKIRICSNNEGFSPWEQKQQSDEDQVQQFCHEILPRIRSTTNRYEKGLTDQQKHQQDQRTSCEVPKVKFLIRRPHTNLQISKENLQHSERKRNLLTRLSMKPQKKQANSGQKAGPQQCKTNYQTVQPRLSSPLQQVSVKNFIAEGFRETHKQIRKKESSYIMKQKYMQIRRSMNLKLGIWGTISRKTSKEVTNYSTIHHESADATMISILRDKENRFVPKMKKL